MKKKILLSICFECVQCMDDDVDTYFKQFRRGKRCFIEWKIGPDCFAILWRLLWTWTCCDCLLLVSEHSCDLTKDIHEWRVFFFVFKLFTEVEQLETQNVSRLEITGFIVLLLLLSRTLLCSDFQRWSSK